MPFDEDAIRPVYRGAILAPWPNRVVDGRYEFDGAEHQLPLTEPDRGHALHGLLVWARWHVASSTSASVRLEAEVVPSDGYPFALDVAVTYALDDGGLTTTVDATNAGSKAAPYGTAPHPYLSAGPGRVDDWTLTLPAADYLEVTEERLIPVATHPVATHRDFDFRSAKPIGDLFLDHAFTGLERDGGTSTVTVTAPGGTGVAMSWGTELPWVQVHTADRPEPELDRLGLAVEPMTCPPDAFSSGTDLVRLEPGQAHTAAWTISAL
ncbi:galactose mutarotase [Frondihabitans sucicola]|uniref:Galactose mutarotase n=1 Tax=Frondihabitans sucicola TaxID=1268041 RepID=A0ABN6Y3Q5_9MICO|nr:galactose mutarotase [Frondihabitans sucicola]